MRPGSVALLPVSTASTGLLCLSVGARVHHDRSDTEVSMWLLPHAYHVQCMTYTYMHTFKILLSFNHKYIWKFHLQFLRGKSLSYLNGCKILPLKWFQAV